MKYISDMKHLKKFSAETAFKQDDIDHIRDIVISWADDFDFDIIESNDDSPGIYFQIHKGFIVGMSVVSNIKIDFNVKYDIPFALKFDDDHSRLTKNFDILKSRINDLINHIESSGDYVYYPSDNISSWGGKKSGIRLTFV